MEKIFEKEVQEYLRASGVSEKEINKIKFTKIKEFAINRLKTIVNLLENDKFNEISQFTAYSPSGDGMGWDNNYIDFSEIGGYSSLDILELTSELEQLKAQL